MIRSDAVRRREIGEFADFGDVRDARRRRGACLEPE